MEHKKALDILAHLQQNSSLSEEEKEAVGMAVGILSWTSLAKNRLKNHKVKREKDSKWEDLPKSKN